MDNFDKSGNKTTDQRKTYSKPAIELVPLYPKQIVLGGTCLTTSNNSGPINLGCGLSGCLDA